MKVETVLVSTFIALDEVGTVFGCTVGYFERSPIEIESVQCHYCQRRFEFRLVSDVDMARVAFAIVGRLGDDDFGDVSIAAEMQMVLESLLVVERYRQAMNEDEILLDNSCAFADVRNGLLAALLGMIV